MQARILTLNLRKLATRPEHYENPIFTLFNHLFSAQKLSEDIPP